MRFPGIRDRKLVVVSLNYEYLNHLSERLGSHPWSLHGGVNLVLLSWTHRHLVEQGELPADSVPTWAWPDPSTAQLRILVYSSEFEHTPEGQSVPDKIVLFDREKFEAALDRDCPPELRKATCAGTCGRRKMQLLVEGHGPGCSLETDEDRALRGAPAVMVSGGEISTPEGQAALEDLAQAAVKACSIAPEDLAEAAVSKVEESYEKSPGPCSLCGEQAEDRCEQLAGPCCHKTLTFADCLAGSRARTKRLFEEMDRSEAAYEVRQKRKAREAQALAVVRAHLPCGACGPEPCPDAQVLLDKLKEIQTA